MSLDIPTNLNFIYIIYRDLKDKTMADKLMYISNNDKQNYPLCRLKLVVEKLGHST